MQYTDSESLGDVVVQSSLMSLMVTFPVAVFLIDTLPSEPLTATKSSPRRRPDSVALSTILSLSEEQLVTIGGMVTSPMNAQAETAMPIL